MATIVQQEKNILEVELYKCSKTSVYKRDVNIVSLFIHFSLTATRKGKNCTILILICLKKIHIWMTKMLYFTINSHIGNKRKY